MMMMKEKIPQLLIFLRLALVVPILTLAFTRGVEGTVWIAVCMYVGLLSDIFDGIIARKLHVSSAKLRRLDSQVDCMFWLSILYATWTCFPDLIHSLRVPIIVLLLLEVACYGISFAKFGKEPCTHAFLAKLWGISLLVAFTSILGFHIAGLPFQIAAVLGLFAQLDVILILLFLPHWAHDIPSSYHAFLLRRGKTFRRHALFNG